jgi:hypothetical protein
MSMRAFLASWTQYTVWFLGFWILHELSLGVGLNEVFFLGLHLDSFVSVQLLGEDIAAHSLLLLSHLDWVSVIVYEGFWVLVCIGAQSIVQLIDFTKLLNVLLDFVDVLLLVKHDVFAFEIEILNKAV